ncbi:MAG: hypothetical protein KC729_10080, partial [Candidatus Eisenbacteria bacterium]|nr:hypothetical protein [Candidatus Eisenbacteria bacterium]
MSTRFHPTTRALVVAGSGFLIALAAVLISPQLAPIWMAFWFSLALALGIDLVFLGSSKTLHAEIELPRTLAIGTVHHVPLHVTRRVQRTFVADAVLSVSGHLDRLPPQRLEVAGGEGTTTFPFRAHLRGPVRAETISLRYPGPLGLLRCTVELGSDAE